MNPGTVRGQSIAASLCLLALAVSGRPLLVSALTVAGGGWALVLNVLYARKLAGQGRTRRRMDGDSAIARQLLISYALPFAVGLAFAATDLTVDATLHPLKASEVQGLLGVVAIMLVAWLASSHADWYYVRPRLDGVVVSPPCLTSRDTMWKGVTRKWYIHRTIASLVTMLAVVAVALIVTLVLDREWPNALAQVGGFAAIVAVGLWLMSDELKSAGSTSRSIRSPRYWIGDDLKYDTDLWRRRGYVLHVAIPVTKLIPLDRDNGSRITDAPYVEEPSSLLAEVRCVSGRFEGCPDASGGCSRFNTECTFGQPREEIGCSHRLIV